MGLKEKKSFVRLPESRGFWVALSVILPVTEIALLIIFFRDELNNDEIDIAFISNFVLGIAASSALPLAIWRGIVGDKQSTAAKIQADTAQQGLRNERYQKGAEMLGSNVLSVRMGGIYALQRLDKEHPEEYHVQIMRLLCAFVRRPTPDKVYEAELQANFKAKLQAEIKPRLHAGIEGPVAREDVQEAMQVIGARSEKEIALEKTQEFELDLRHASLRHMNIRGANLTGAFFYKADLFEAFSLSVDLTDAWFGGANLSGAQLGGASLSGATLLQAKVSDTSFAGVKGLTQSQLDLARRTKPGEKPPNLRGALDAQTGEQLQWNGGI